MLRNYLLTAWQTLARQKLFALINILGLAIGLCVFILIFLFVEREYSYDRHWNNAEHIHWLTHESSVNDSTSFKSPFSPYPVMQLIREYFPEEIEHSARLLARGDFIHIGENRFQGNIAFAEKEVLDIFNFEVVAGSLEAAMAVPGRVALNETAARRYFSGENPVGRTLSLELTDQGLFDYQVSAIFRIPEETALFFASLSLLEETALPGTASGLESWTGPSRVTNYFLLKPDADIETMNRRLVDVVNQVVPKEPWRIMEPDEQMSDFHRYEFQPITEAHFDASLRIGNRGNKAKVIIFALIGVLVLLMGGTNFVILATAKADERKREVGVRKVLGAKNGQLMVQFLGESVLYALAALLLAVILVMFTLPFFEGLISQNLSFDLLDPMNLLLLLLLTVIVGVLGGLYPAFILAGFSPVSVFKTGATRVLAGSVSIRSVLAGFQFTVAIILIIATLVLYFQLSLLKNLDLGFDPERLFVVDLYNQEVRKSLTPLVNEIKRIPGVQQVALSTRQPAGDGTGMFTGGSYIREQNGREADYQGIWVGYDFFDVYGMEMLAGRPYDPDLDFSPRSPPREENQSAERQVNRLVINRHLADSLGFAAPEAAIGQLIHQKLTGAEGQVRRVPSEVIGVVENSRFSSLREPTISETYLLGNTNSTTLTIKYQDAVAASIQEEIENVWKNVLGDAVFRGHFIEQSLLEAFTQEENDGRLLMAFSLLSIFVSCMGLYGLAAYTVKKSVKEVGIRKVLGAKFSSILLLFAWRFSKPVLIANVMAWPVALWAMLQWLQRFPEQIDYILLLPICLLAALLALTIAWLTVAATTARAARANPVESLRYE